MVTLLDTCKEVEPSPVRHLELIVMPWYEHNTYCDWK